MSRSAPEPEQRSHSPWLWPVGLIMAGTLQAAALAWPGTGQPLWWLQILALALLCAALQHASSARQAMGWSWCFATAWLCGSFWWLFISMHTYGGLPAVLAVLAVLLLAAFLGGYYALLMGVYFRGRRAGWQAVLLFAACWTLGELARGTLWTGFPWGAIAYAHIEGPLAVLPRWLGVYGTGALAAALSMMLVQSRQLWRRPVLSLSVVGILAVVVAAAGWSRNQATQIPGREPVEVALLQGNIPQDEKFMPGQGIDQALHWYGQQLLQASATLVVAPETALPLLPQQLPPGYLDSVSAPYRLAQGQSAALVGIPLGDEVQGYSNAVVGWVPGEVTEYRYDKQHLVPFGEFIPPLFQWFVRLMHIPLGEFQRGGLNQASMHWHGERWAPNICYEDLFGEELGLRFRDPAQAPTVWVNVSNIAWFGDSIAIDQHLQISRMRALEFEKPMLRATNTGATAVIDHRGQVTAALPSATQAVLVAQVQGRDGMTPYAHWVSRWGLWPLWLLCVLAVVGCMWQRQRTSNK